MSEEVDPLDHSSPFTRATIVRFARSSSSRVVIHGPIDGPEVLALRGSEARGHLVRLHVASAQVVHDGDAEHVVERLLRSQVADRSRPITTAISSS